MAVTRKEQRGAHARESVMVVEGDDATYAVVSGLICVAFFFLCTTAREVANKKNIVNGLGKVISYRTDSNA